MPSIEPPSSLSPTDSLARYATQSNHFNTFGATFLLFMPHKKSLLLSVFCTTALEVDDIMEIAWKNLPFKVYGHGPSFVAFIKGLGLEIDYDKDPERHANVYEWPDSKDGQKNLAQKLAREVNKLEAFHLYPQPIEPVTP